jgi:curved DNA-binding protein CbpA
MEDPVGRRVLYARPLMAEKVPRLVANVDVRTFKLDATAGFLLTRIDGRSGPRQLARDTGLPEFQVEKTLENLEKLGVVELLDPNAPVVSALPPPPVRDRTQLPQFGSIGGAPKYDPKELDEEVELSAEQKKRVLDMFYRLGDLDHYTLLGVGRDADKKTVKRSYFELAALMHPDRYFKKKLGSFKSKMEELFARITDAHDTLVDAAKRLDYDAYLDEVATTKGMEAMLERAVEESRRLAETAAATEATRDSIPSPARLSSSPDARASVAPEVPAGPSAQEVQARREALAKRLLGGQSVRPAAASVSPVEAPNPLRYTNSGDAVDALKRRYEERVDKASAANAQRYVKAAEDSLFKNDLVAAANSFNIATKFAPDDTALAMRYQETKNQAENVLCESYVKQATYEERNHQWPEAARTWQKVCKVKLGDPDPNHHAANCLLRTDGGDLHHAAEHAKVAVAGAPSVVEYHVTLAEIYLKAGLLASARRAAEAGLNLDSKNVVLLGIQKRAAKT